MKIPRNMGREAMSALETREGEWFSDTP